MTQRDIAKDKEYLEWARKETADKYAKLGVVYDMAEYWIAQYEEMQQKCKKYMMDCFDLHGELEAAQAHISDLEAQLASKTP